MNDDKDEQRIIVYVCDNCHKLIGTRENFFVFRTVVNNKIIYMRICEGYYDYCK